MIYGLCLLLLFAGCQEEFQKSREEIVVEGWIESGGSPVVLLTKSFVVELAKDVDEETSIVLPWGKVTVSDGTESVILTGDYDDRYFPPYIYSTSKMKGVPGRTYYLTVEYGNRILTAQTTIPEVDSLEAITVSTCDDADGMYQITAYYDDNPVTKDYYLFLTRIYNDETRYYPAFLGLQEDGHLGLHNRQVVHPGIHTLTDSVKYHPYYHADDSIQIKFAKIDETTYHIHKAYNEMVSLSSNPIFSSDLSMPTNIQGGLGFWCGYAVTRYNVSIGDSIK
ncbi:MAG: DUF4249 domain-containing protein [Bacteroidaceae bacterium]|nr:DUF4249 domain-containing protein [Bacteroidaceae bacterium]MBO7267729.1 DUF4249 domain-containing protein [Bacteroidaceae bacterium]